VAVPVPVPVTRRHLLRLARAGALSLPAALLTGCSAADREALLAVDPRDVRLDRDEPVAARPEPSERERRRRAVLAGSLAAVSALTAAGASGGAAPTPLGLTGGVLPTEEALAVHRGHVDLLGGTVGAVGTVGPGTERSLGVRPQDGGPLLPPAARPVAVLAAGTSAALAASREERAAGDADPGLALLHARIAAARAAQALGLGSTPGPGTGLPTAVRTPPAGDTGGWPVDAGPPAAGVVAALQDLLVQEHRARWSYAVVQAWSTDRSQDAGAARENHTRAVAQLQALLSELGEQPGDARSTYPTADGAAPVADPRAAAALALRLEDAVAAASAAVLAAAVAADPDAATGEGWLAAAVSALADAERSRWSWGGPADVLPGG